MFATLHLTFSPIASPYREKRNDSTADSRSHNMTLTTKSAHAAFLANPEDKNLGAVE